MKIVVAGGTGRIGLAVIAALNAAGHVAGSAGADTVSSVGLAAKTRGAGAVLDVTDPLSLRDRPSTAHFQTSTRSLLIAEMQTGVRHHVLLSVVGADRVAGPGYYRAKLEQEEAVRDGAVPYTIVRSTLLFESLAAIIRRTGNGPARLPPTLVQPIATADLVPELARIVAGSSADGIVEVAGPEARALDEIARLILRADGDHNGVVTDAGARPFFGLDVDDDALLPGPAARIGRTDLATWIKHRTA